ncbi:hypothetical protein SprV_0100129700 [Sparganum proliferum]
MSDGVDTDDGDEFGSPKRRTEVHEAVFDALRQTGQSSHNVPPDDKGDARVASLYLSVALSVEGVYCTHLLQLAFFVEAGLA